jgi:hypothetical protein
MRNLLIALTICSLAVHAESVAAPHEFVAEYRSEDKVPQTLLDAYVKFAETAQAAGGLKPLLLPHAVEITTGARPEKMREYGTDINLPFLASRFNPKVFSIRRDADDAWLIRTGTSAIWFVETKSGKWRVYQYLDKPIQ